MFCALQVSAQERRKKISKLWHEAGIFWLLSQAFWIRECHLLNWQLSYESINWSGGSLNANDALKNPRVAQACRGSWDFGKYIYIYS